MEIDRENRIIVARFNPNNMCGDGMLFLGQISYIDYSWTPDAPVYDEQNNIIGSIIAVEETANNGDMLITVRINSEEAWQHLKDMYMLPEGA